MDWSSIVGEWHRDSWMESHGEWASSRWDDARAERDEARSALAAALTEAADAAEDGDEIEWDEIEAARERLDAADKALDGAVDPEDDYIAEGTIDPDGVQGEPGTEVWSDSWQGWDCREGEEVYLSVERGGIRVVHHWWRDAHSRTRHDRDLWRVVTVVDTPRGIAEILDDVALDVARDLWADLRSRRYAHSVDEIAEHLSEELRRDLGLIEAEELDEDAAAV
jgi:hypothetical protein